MTKLLKPGDRVRFIVDYGTLVRKGDTATVVEDRYTTPSTVAYRMDNTGRVVRGYPSRVTKIAESRSEGRFRAPEVTTLKTPAEAGRTNPTASQQGSRGEALANGERMQEYGHPKVSFDRIARMWSSYLSATEVDPENLSGEDVGHLMTLLKISRSITDKKADTLDDIEGYVACIRMLRSSL